MSSEGTEEVGSMNPHEVEKLEEAKLKAKYPIGAPAAGKMSGHTAFLQKRLAKGQKYFDSGDYQMNLQRGGGGANRAQTAPKAPIVNPYATGEAIPTPESVPVRKTSIIQPKFTPHAS